MGFHVDRRTPAGGWQRVSGGLIPTVGSDQQPHAYILTDALPPGVGELTYRLMEVDSRGRETVMAEATVSPASWTWVERTGNGVRLQVRGAPDGTVVVESAAAVQGPWSAFGRVSLDEGGMATISLEPNPQEPVRFYRLFTD